MFKSVSKYFSSGLYELHIFKLLGFNNKEYTTFRIVSISRKKNKGTWFFNNLWFPGMVIISPILLTGIHSFFNTVSYNKSFIEILLGGGLTLLGINVIRTASTAMSEKLNPAVIPDSFEGRINELIDEIDAMRSKLERRIWFLSYFGWGLYMLQIGQFINTSSSVIYLILFIIIILMLISVLHGRFIGLLKTNILDTEQAVGLLFGKLLFQNDDYNNLEDILKRQGL